MSGTLIIKVAAQCNLRCTYCYWFAEPGAESSGAMSDRVISKTVERIREYLQTNPGRLNISLHGGEPLLVGKRRFARFCNDVRKVAIETSSSVSLACQTNGTLIDNEWVSIFRHFNVEVGVSIDGPERIHDQHRINNKSRGSFRDAVRGYSLLRNGGLDPAILAVWSPASDATEVSSFFVHELGASWFDVLMPDATHESPTEPFYEFFQGLFDLWLSDLLDRDIEVRVCSGIARSLMGLGSRMESIGLNEVRSAAIATDGSYQLLDVLNIAGQGLSRTRSSVFSTDIRSFYQSAEYLGQVDQSVRLAPKCLRCRYMSECGGGYLPSRWSRENGFNNPSVHCESLFKIFEYCEFRLRGRLREVFSSLAVV